MTFFKKCAVLAIMTLVMVFQKLLHILFSDWVGHGHRSPHSHETIGAGDGLLLDGVSLHLHVGHTVTQPSVTAHSGVAHVYATLLK